MPSTYSPNLKIELIGIGEQTDAWGSTTNDNFENVFEEAITGMATATFPSDADYNWAAGYVNSVGSQAQRNLVIEVNGTISLSRNFIVPTIEKQYLVHNNTTGGQSIVVKTAAGSGVTIPNGQRAHLYVNGTNVIAVVDYFPSLRAGAATLDTPLPVTSGGTGSTSLATITVGTATNVAGGAANRIPYNTGAGVTSFIAAPTVASTYLQWDGSAFAWATVTGGVTTFSAGTTGLTPSTATTGAVTLAGTLAVANGGTGVTTSTGSGANVLGTNPTLSGPTINDGYTEEVYTLATGGPGATTPALSPTNGSIQLWGLVGDSTPTAGTWASGQSIVLMIDDGTGWTVNWTSMPVTWVTNAGLEPILATSGYTVIILWKVVSTIYGARVGDNS
jgi:hypothetical protein